MTTRDMNILGSVAAVLAIAVLGWHFLNPVSKAVKDPQKLLAEKRDMEQSITELRDKVTMTRNKADEWVWLGDRDQIAVDAMARVNDQVGILGLKMISFRPQRSIVDGSVERLPYQVTLDGAFPAVIGFVRAMETPEARFCVSKVQIASADGATDRVSATIGLVAYREAEEKKDSK